MSKTRNILGAALLAVGMVSAVQAAATVLDFETYAGSNVAPGGSVASLPNGGTDQPFNPGDVVTNQYANLGVSFSTSNFVARNASRVGGNVTLPPDPPNGSANFLMNSASGASFVMTVLAGFQLTTLKLDVAFNSAGFGIFFNNDATLQGGANFSSSFLSNWSSGVDVQLPTGIDIRSVEFRSVDSSSRFAIDNIELTLNPTGLPGVPEPAALGLVALALAGVAATSRARQKR